MSQETRQHLIELLDGKSAHIGLEISLAGFPVYDINRRVDGSPHTAWQLVEHIRIAQRDIIDYCRDPKHVSPVFPEGYWNTAAGTAATWQTSIEQITDDLKSFRDMIANEEIDLMAPLPNGSGHTIFREALVLADHNSYHLGQIVLLKRMIENEAGQT